MLGECRKNPRVAEVTEPRNGRVVSWLHAHLHRHMELTPDEG
jgi:hypothetical protein